MNIRTPLKKFTLMMERILSLKDSDKGKNGWIYLDYNYLYSKVEYHRNLSYKAFYEGDMETAIYEIIHSANYSMMIFDNLSFQFMEVER